MKKNIFLLLLLICHVHIFAQDISGTWSSDMTDEPNITVNIRKNSQGIYLLSVSYNGDVASFVESKREQEVVNNEIEHTFFFDCTENNKPEFFKEGLCLTYYSRANSDIPNEINIRCRDYLYRYVAWNIYRSQNNYYTTARSSSSSYARSSNIRSSDTHGQSEVMGYISVTVGRGGHWTFKFSSIGTFQSHEWYGNDGKYSTKGSMRKESYSSGTYTIRKENGVMFVYLRYANGSESKAKLRYESGRAVLVTGINTSSMPIHKQIGN